MPENDHTLLLVRIGSAVCREGVLYCYIISEELRKQGKENGHIRSGM